MTAAAEIAAAAERLRALTTAVDAPDLPDQSWHTEECASEERGNCPCIVAQGRFSDRGAPPVPLFYVADAETPEVAAYVATMGPDVGLALADWLDAEALRVGAAHPGWQVTISPHALALARQINRSQP